MSEEKRSHKLWGGRFSQPSDPALDALNRSIDTDFRLWPDDIRLSQAWAMALWGAGVLSLEESRAIERGLQTVGSRIAGGEKPIASDEDVHTMIDRLLHDEVGEVASKLHTGRSRNDQVATATRLWTMNAAVELAEQVRALQQAILNKARMLQDVYMPAYTHLQRAQPVAAAHWILAHFWALDRDRGRINSVSRSASTLPLGSGAVAGSAYPISRQLLQGRLGFAAISQNSIDAVGDRDFIAEMLFASAMLGVHLSRIAEDLILYGSSEFGFVRFGERFTTGSSMMPQKRNPDALELARASAPRTLGDLVTLLGVLKGLPSGYNKDLQEDKRALFNAYDAMLLVLPAVRGTIDELTFDEERMRQALSTTMMATDLADYLVKRGATFRQAHEAVGNLIREAESRGCDLRDLEPAVFQSSNSLFGDDTLEYLDAKRSASLRDIPGGTGPQSLGIQIKSAEDALSPKASTRGNQIDFSEFDYDRTNSEK